MVTINLILDGKKGQNVRVTNRQGYKETEVECGQKGVKNLRSLLLERR